MGACILSVCAFGNMENKGNASGAEQTMSGTTVLAGATAQAKEVKKTEVKKTETKKPSKKKKSSKTILKSTLKAVKKEFGDQYLPNMPIDATWLSETCGIKSSWYDTMLGELPMISTHVDTYISIHATKGNIKKVKAALNEYKRYLAEDSLQYPMNQTKVESCKVYTKGNYAYFIMLGTVDNMDLSEKEQKKAYEANNQKVVDIINKNLK